MSYTQFFYHLIFRTKYGRQAIVEEHEKQLYMYIWGYIRNKKSTLYRINGMPDHLHMLVDINPQIAVASFIRDLKSQTSKWIKESCKFPEFCGWGDGYGGLTYCVRDRDMLIGYIKKQKVHHKTDFATEFRRILEENGIKINEKWLLKD